MTPVQKKRAMIFGGATVLVFVLFLFAKRSGATSSTSSTTQPTDTAVYDPSTGQWIDQATGAPIDTTLADTGSPAGAAGGSGSTTVSDPTVPDFSGGDGTATTPPPTQPIDVNVPAPIVTVNVPPPPTSNAPPPAPTPSPAPPAPGPTKVTPPDAIARELPLPGGAAQLHDVYPTTHMLTIATPLDTQTTPITHALQPATTANPPEETQPHPATAVLGPPPETQPHVTAKPIPGKPILD